MLAHRLAELRIVGHAGIVERGQVELHEPSALGLGDPEAAVDVNEVREAELAREPVRTAEALCREHRQMLDVLWPPCAEQRLEQRIGEHAVVGRPARAGAVRPRRPRARRATSRSFSSSWRKPSTSTGAPSNISLARSTTRGCGTLRPVDLDLAQLRAFVAVVDRS